MLENPAKWLNKAQITIKQVWILRPFPFYLTKMTWPDFDLFHKISLKMSPGWARARLDSSLSRAAARTQSSTLTLCRTTPWRPSWIPFTKPTLLLWNFQVWNLPKTPLESAKKWWKGQIWRRSTQWSDSILGQRQNKQENGGRKFEDFEQGAPPSSPSSRWKWTRP